jgi:hypothetical protein
MSAKETSTQLEAGPSESASPSFETELTRILREHVKPARRVIKATDYARLQGWSQRTLSRRIEAGLPVSSRPGVPVMVDIDVADDWLAGIDPPRHGRRLPILRRGN